MGDRCWFQCWVRKEDAEKFESLVDVGSPNDEDAKCFQYIDEQANYGHHDSLKEAAKEGCIFYGYHMNGEEYGSYTFLSDDRGYADWQNGHVNYGFVLHMDPKTSELDDQEMINLRAFHRRLVAIEKMFDCDASEKPGNVG